jgi:hypothetical protein
MIAIAVWVSQSAELRSEESAFMLWRGEEEILWLRLNRRRSFVRLGPPPPLYRSYRHTVRSGVIKHSSMRRAPIKSHHCAPLNMRLELKIREHSQIFYLFSTSISPSAAPRTVSSWRVS